MKKNFLVIFLVLVFIFSALLPACSSFSLKNETIQTINSLNKIKVLDVIRDDDGTNEDSVDLDNHYDRAIKYLVIPPEYIGRIKSAKLYIYGQSFGEISSGNSHQLDLNNAYVKFNTYDYFKSDEFNWGYIKIIQPWLLKSGVNIIEIKQVAGSSSNRFLRIGIDQDNDFDRSKWWSRDSDTEPTTTPEECDGELMIYLELNLIRERPKIFSNIFDIFPILNRLDSVIIR